MAHTATMEPPPPTPKPVLQARHQELSPKAKVQAVCEFNDAHGIAYFKADMFRFFRVSPRSAYRAISTASLSDIPNDAPETRGGPPKIKKDDVMKLEWMLEDGGIHTEGMSWQQLAHAAGFEHVHCRTIRNHIEETDFHRVLRVRGLGCLLIMDRGGFNLPNFASAYGRAGKIGNTFASRVRFTLDSRLKAISKSFADLERGWNYKSILVFYNVPGNSNGKLSQKVYMEQILEPHVKPCLVRGEQFVLEEEDALGHGSGDTNNTVRQWKQDHGLRCYFSCPKSPDLSIVEKCWRPVEQFLAANPQHDEQSAINTIVQSWQEHVSQEWINRMVVQFPETLQEVYQTQGRMTGS